MEETIKERIEQVRNKIEIAKAKSPFKQDVKLIAVSKTVGIDAVKEAINCNITDFGENKPQELKKKAQLINQNVSWHQIGTLQTNKIKYIIDKVKLIHSLDRENLAYELDKRARENDITIQCLVQINISQEDSKHGLPYNQAVEFVKKISETCPNVQIVGLMGMAPYLENPQDTRPYFKKMQELFQEINFKKINNITLRELSMGMSNDYEVAIEEGATMVRVGTKIFGERIYL